MKMMKGKVGRRQSGKATDNPMEAFEEEFNRDQFYNDQAAFLLSASPAPASAQS
jgi:hypothetical protein